MAVYPAYLAPHPWPYPFAMDREAGIAAYEAMVTAAGIQGPQGRLAICLMVIHRYTIAGDAPVMRVELTKVRQDDRRCDQV